MASTMKNIVPARWQTAFSEITARHGSVIASLLAGVASGQLETFWGRAQLLISGATLLGFATYQQFREWAQDKSREQLEQELLQRIQNLSKEQTRLGERQSVHLHNIQQKLMSILQQLDQQSRTTNQSFDHLLTQFLQSPTVADDSFWGGLQREVEWARDDIAAFCEQMAAMEANLTQKIEDSQQKTVHQLTNPGMLAEAIRTGIREAADAKIAALPQGPGRWQKVAEIENERDAQMGRVDDLLKLIQHTYESGASGDYQQAVDIWQTEGTDAALAYLESRRAAALENAKRHANRAKEAAAQAETEKEERNKSLQQFVLEAQLLESQLKWQPAIELLQKVVDLAPDWFSAHNHLGALLLETARYSEAETHLRACITLVTNTEDEGLALYSLSQLLKATNRLEEAEPLMQRALMIDEHLYGPDHPDVARDLNNLALLLQATNRLAEAEPLMRRALKIDEHTDGPNHLNVARDLNNLSHLLHATNRLAEAEPLMRRALKIGEHSYGLDHPMVAICLNNLSHLLHATNRLAEAEPLMRRGLKIDEHSYGPDHPNVAIRLNNLAQLLQATNRLAEAEPLMRRALEIDEHSYGPDHPDVARDLNNLAQLLQVTNGLAEAEPLMQRALQINEHSYGPDHPNVAIDLNNLASLLQATNRLAEAEPLMRRALQIDKQSYGPGHPKVAIRLNNLASLLQATNRLAEAEPLMRRALQIDKQSYGPGHPKVAIRLNNLAQLLQATNRLAEAEPLMRHALEIDEQSYGPDHPNVAIRLNNLASLLQATNRLAEAEPLMRRVVEIFQKFNVSSGHEHPRMQAAISNYQQLLAEM